MGGECGRRCVTTASIWVYCEQALSKEMSAGGVFIDPHHHTFMTAAHADDDIDRTLETAAGCSSPRERVGGAPRHQI